MVDGFFLCGLVEHIGVVAMELFPISNVLTFNILPNVGDGPSEGFGQQLHWIII